MAQSNWLVRTCGKGACDGGLEIRQSAVLVCVD
jgi:hypothetical protein